MLFNLVVPESTALRFSPRSPLSRGCCICRAHGLSSFLLLRKFRLSGFLQLHLWFVFDFYRVDLVVFTIRVQPADPRAHGIHPTTQRRLSVRQGRKVTWHTSQGNADLKSTFGKNRHDLNVSTQQMCILLLFNHADTLSYAEIQEATQVGGGTGREGGREIGTWGRGYRDEGEREVKGGTDGKTRHADTETKSGRGGASAILVFWCCNGSAGVLISWLGAVFYSCLVVLRLPFEWFYVVSKRNSCRFLLLLLRCCASLLFFSAVTWCDAM